MKNIHLILIGVIVWGLLGAATVNAADTRMTRGFFGGMKNSRILVDSPAEGKEYFEITRETQLIKPGKPISISKLPRHSIVQVISKNGVALQIVVVEVPK